MSITIYKYPLTIEEEQVVEIHEQHHILKVNRQITGNDFGKLEESTQMWCLVDTDSPIIKKRILMFQTGSNRIDRYAKNINHIGTVNDDPYIWHYFELLNDEQ